jgi:hypothetical protein
VSLALSRTCDLRDFASCATVAGWQQALAEASWQQWQEAQHVRTRAPSLCVNWSGCPFIAPGATAIYQERRKEPRTAQGGNGVPTSRLPAVYGLSVLDRIDAPVRFLSESTAILRPTGLLFLTFAFWDAEGPDVAAGALDRRRIYDLTSVKKLLIEARRVGLIPFGGVDWTYHGDKLDDHTLASLVLVRR